MTERFRNEGEPLNEQEQHELDGLAKLLLDDASLGASVVEFNTAAARMLPVLDSEPAAAETSMLLPEDAIKEDEDGLYVDMGPEDHLNTSGSLLEKDPWYLQDGPSWKPSGARLTPQEARDALDQQEQIEATLPWYRRKIGRIVGALGCFGAAAAAIAAGAAGFVPASPKIPDTLVLRDKIAHNPDLLRNLGICASELRAQNDLDDTVMNRPTGRQLRTLTITEEAVKTAEKHSLPCVSSSGQEMVVVDGIQMTRPEMTIYKNTNWCDQRKEILADAPLNTKQSRRDVLEVGNRHFGFRCQ